MLSVATRSLRHRLARAASARAVASLSHLDAAHVSEARTRLSARKQLASVPIIDFSAFLSGDEAAREATGKQLFASMKDIGFVTIINHGLPQSLTTQAWEEAENFFALPREVKKRYAFKSPEANRGYLAVGEEKGDFRVPDLRETFNIGDEHDHVHENHWPQELPEFKSAMLQFYENSNALHLEVLRCLAIGMGLGEEFFTPLCDGRFNTLRLLHYPECKRSDISDEVEGRKRVGAHTDYGELPITAVHARPALLTAPLVPILCPALLTSPSRPPPPRRAPAIRPRFDHAASPARGRPVRALARW